MFFRKNAPEHETVQGHFYVQWSFLYFLLMFPQFLKNSAVLSEMFKRSLISYASILKNIHIVKFSQKMQAVQAGKNGFSAEFFKQAVIYLHFRFGVHAACWLIQQHNVTASCRQNSPRQGQPLFLSTREVHSFFLNVGLQSVGQLRNHFRKMRRFAYCHDVGFVKRQSERNVIFDRIFKNLRLLRKQRYGIVDDFQSVE